jgi:outer membrane lipoprotein
MSRRIWFVAIAGALGLGGCATIPPPLAGNYTPVSLSQARSGTGTATRVRWGGEIIQTEPREQQTCFFVLAEPLDSQARPRQGEDSEGRFIACKAGFYDPETFRKGREITVTGTLDGTVQHKVGQYDYTYPKVEADTVYLWKPQPVYVAQPYPWPWYDPFWGGPWGAWGAWYPPPVIVAPPPPPPPPSKK